ncbi:MAG: hypothetical protein NTW30_02390, partial [Candidatus Aenigmarchaeota archaeon]|nr:hypothetical protein [Candidatus Aenigmarchaeota archaeon]
MEKIEKPINPIEDMLRFEIPKNIKKIQGTEIQQHYCFQCGAIIPISGHEEWCPKCKWTKCPHCGGCACTLTKEAQMAVRGVFLTFCQYCNNPCKRKHMPTAKEIEYAKNWEQSPDY